MTSSGLPEQFVRTTRSVRGLYPSLLIANDVVAFIPAFFAAGLLRNEVGSVPLAWTNVVWVALIALVAFLLASWPLQLYRNRYVVSTFEEVLYLGYAWVAGGFIASLINLFVITPRVPTSIVGMGMMFAGAWMLASRVLWRLMRTAESRPDPAGRTRVLVFGAGDGGTQVVKSMLGDSSSRYVPVGLLDDDPRKQNRMIEGIHVLGTSDDVMSFRGLADTLLIAVPSANKELLGRLADQAAKADLNVMILPSTTELFGMMVGIDSARPLSITDLLGRDEVQVDAESVSAYLAGQVVLVTGAGGSIGSELCRQILRYEPARLVMLDRDETALQGVQLSVTGHGLLDDENLVLANIRDRERVFEVFETHRPAIVFHAAALKHLPLLESHPREGLRTNVIGTRNVLDAAKSVGVSRFVNVSTDKAANPTSVLGTTKRIAEALTLRAGTERDGEYMSVRFGNVIGSRGSVLPAFEKQIAAGGPVTVTHPDVTRYFMSIPEASRLVLQAGAIGKTGETLVLDMGEPMKIIELAERLIKHYKSNAKIVFTGLRPNEKLHEVLGHDGEVMEVGAHPLIWHAEAALDSCSPLSEIDGLLEIHHEQLAEKLMDFVLPNDVLLSAGKPSVE